jgi:uncharacterized protein YfdQ (DUF2303 family)
MAGYGGDQGKTRTEADAILEAGRAAAGAEVIDIKGVPFLAYPRDRLEITSFEKLLPAPVRPKAAIRCATPEALVTVVERFATASTMVYADIEKGEIVAVFDDHAPSMLRPALDNFDGAASAERGAGNAGWREHRAVWKAQQSDAWKAWAGIDGKPISQAAFLEHLEDRRGDVVEPVGAELMEIVRDLSGRADVTWRQAVDLHTGAVRMQFEEAVTASSTRGGELVVPKQLGLAIEVYRGSKVVELTCRLRYRVSAGKLTLCVVLDRRREVEEEAFRGALARLVDGLGPVPLIEAAAD